MGHYTTRNQSGEPEGEKEGVKKKALGRSSQLGRKKKRKGVGEKEGPLEHSVRSVQRGF